MPTLQTTSGRQTKQELIKTLGKEVYTDILNTAYKGETAQMVSDAFGFIVSRDEDPPGRLAKKFKSDLSAYMWYQAKRRGYPMPAQAQRRARTAQGAARAAALATNPDRMLELFMEQTKPGKHGCLIWQGSYITRRRKKSPPALHPRFGPGRLADPPDEDARHYIYNRKHGVLRPHTQLMIPTTCDPLCVNWDHMKIKGR